MKNCLDTGTIQAFLDGELTPAEVSTVSAHIAACNACSAQLAAAEEESAFVFSVLEREMDSLVPTQRLWAKINDSLEVEKQTAPFWKKAWVYVLTSLANPSVAVAAGLLIVLGVTTVVFVVKDGAGSSPSVAQAPVSAPVSPGSDTPAFIEQTGGVVTGQSSPEGRVPTLVSYPASKRSIDNRTPSPRPIIDRAVYIPGEDSYVKTIASLNQTVNDQKDSVLRPSERISYERDMAVLNDAIAKMKKEVRRNPKNESAKQVLYTSYQNKIDLLNSVSQREELVASLKD